MAPYMYQPTIQKFCGNENSVQWLEDYISEIEAPGGPGPNAPDMIGTAMSLNTSRRYTGTSFKQPLLLAGILLHMMFAQWKSH
jgi:hypothetical protein